MHVPHETLWNALTALKHKGVKIRIVTQVTSDNLEFCKKFTEAVELKHLDGIQSSFGISDGKWLLEHVVSLDEYPLSYAILTDIRKLVGIKRKLFETLWKQSVPAEEIFMKLELLNPAEVNTKIESNEAEKLLFNLISNPKYRIDMVIRTNDSVNLLELGRLSRCLKDALNQGVKIRFCYQKVNSMIWTIWV
jgi:phosphatidylserine/phosphatidylglycerophosphate/cardiolipin synthase-like enzyme